MHQNLLIANLKSLLEKRRWIDIPSSGVSMYPLIMQGDICRFIPLDSTKKLKKGEIVLFVNEAGLLVGHRYYSHYVKDGETYYICKGDTNTLPDPPVKESQIVGKLEFINKGKFGLTSQGFLSQLWGLIVFTFPFLPRLCRAYLTKRCNIMNN